MDRDPGEGWQHPAGVDRVLTPARSQVVDGQRVGAGHMDPPQLGSDPPAGLVEVCHVRGGQVATSRGQETLEPLRCGGQQRGQPASGDRGAEAVGHRLGRPVDRQVLTTQQVGAQRGHPGPVTRGGRGLGRERRGGHRPTRTGSPLGPVLGHLQLDRWQVEHLPDLLAHDRRVAQVITAGPARPPGRGPRPRPVRVEASGRTPVLRAAFPVDGPTSDEATAAAASRTHPSSAASTSSASSSTPALPTALPGRTTQGPARTAPRPTGPARQGSRHARQASPAAGRPAQHEPHPTRAPHQHHQPQAQINPGAPLSHLNSYPVLGWTFALLGSVYAA